MKIIPRKSGCTHCLQPSRPELPNQCIVLQNVDLKSSCLKSLHELGHCQYTYYTDVFVNWDRLLVEYVTKINPSCQKILCIEGQFYLHHIQNWVTRNPFDLVFAKDEKQPQFEQLVLLSSVPLAQSPFCFWKVFQEYETRTIPFNVSAMVFHTDIIHKNENFQGMTLDAIAKQQIETRNEWVKGVWPPYGSSFEDGDAFYYMLGIIAVLMVLPILFALISSWLLYSLVSSTTITRFVYIVVIAALITFIWYACNCNVNYSTDLKWATNCISKNVKKIPSMAWSYIQSGKNYLFGSSSSK
jgi:hypothetical protein